MWKEDSKWTILWAWNYTDPTSGNMRLDRMTSFLLADSGNLENKGNKKCGCIL